MKRPPAPALAALVLAAASLAAPTRAKADSGPAPLADLVARIRSTLAGGRAAYVVFDLDGTLVDPAPRTWKIFRDYAREQRHRFPGLPDRVRAMDPARFQWPYAPESALALAGVRDSAAVRGLVAAWRERFFGSDEVDQDAPLPGAVEYVDSLHRAGASIVYLTGRPAPRMLTGTTRSLQRCGFPIGIPRTQLVLKPRGDLRDADYKVPVMRELARGGAIVAAFENEPGNIADMHAAFPEARALYVRTVHARDVPLPAAVDTVTTYADAR